MTILLEQPVPILIVGLLVAAGAGVAFVTTGRTHFGIAVVVAIVVTGALLALERFVETDREQVEHALYDTAAAIQANDRVAVLDRISAQSPQVRMDADREIEKYSIASFRINQPDIMLKSDHRPPLATAIFSCVASGRYKGEATPNQTVPVEMLLNLRQESDGVWRITSYKFRLGVGGMKGGYKHDEGEWMKSLP